VEVSCGKNRPCADLQSDDGCIGPREACDEKQAVHRRGMHCRVGRRERTDRRAEVVSKSGAIIGNSIAVNNLTPERLITRCGPQSRMRLRTCTDDRARCELHVKQRRNGRLQVQQDRGRIQRVGVYVHAGFEGRDGIRVPMAKITAFSCLDSKK